MAKGRIIERRNADECMYVRLVGILYGRVSSFCV